MTTAHNQTFKDLFVDYIEFYVDDIQTSADRFVDGYGFEVYAATDPGDEAVEARSVGLGRNQIRLVLTEPSLNDHPASAYVTKHGDGVADIAFGVADATAAFNEAVRRGARPVSAPTDHGGVITATVMGFGDVAHTLVQRSGDTNQRALPGLVPVSRTHPGWDAGLRDVDHFAVCVEAGQLTATVEFYEQVFDFRTIFTERIVIGAQAMDSTVVQSASGAVTLTLLEPDVSRSPGQIDEFVKNHGGAGVQHIAFVADDIVRTVDGISSRGVEFLETPDTYYTLLAERIEVARHPVEELNRLNILVDEDHDGQLFQIFARSTHPRRTFFVEVIERLGARTFGSGNIKALYEAVELQRSKDAATG